MSQCPQDDSPIDSARVAERHEAASGDIPTSGKPQTRELPVSQADDTDTPVREDGPRFALIGNPNAGKTTLFNVLTGSNQHVGNWPGVTVEKKEGSIRPEYGGGVIVDLPGIYSLSPYSIEERVSRSYIIDDKPDVVIDIVEATNIERNLFLTTQIAELGVPMVVAVNMMDEARREGDHIDIERLSSELGLPVVAITAVRAEGIDELMDVVGREVRHEPHPGYDEHGHGIYDDEDALEHIQDHHSDAQGRVNALVSSHRYHNHYKGPMVVQQLAESPLSRESEEANAQARYAFIDQVVRASVTKGRKAGTITRSDKVDRVLCNRFASIPIFLLVMWFMFHCTFSENFLGLGLPSPGVALQDLMVLLIDWISSVLEPLFTQGSWQYSLVFDGIISGVGAVLSFLPQILVLFFFLTLLEDIGYMSRAAFIMDRLMRRFGLSGKSFMPMLMGFGCNVPAMMSCRTMDNEQDRKTTLFLVPFMSCGARAPILLTFAAAFFPTHADLMVFALYAVGILVAIITGLILKRVVFHSEATPLLIELPRYRTPRWRSLGLALKNAMVDYVKRAGTIIFAMTIVIWFLSSFSPDMQMCAMDESILAYIGRAIAPFFGPLGFGFWTAATALLTGIFAKEAVIGTMGVLYSSSMGEESGLTYSVLSAAGFTPLSALSFLVFTLLYVPCMATVATLARESNSWRWTLAQVCYSIAVAWVCSFVVFQVGSLLGFS
jgi:ferrous iron transport protein B